MITNVHIFAMGFQQTVAKITGIERVWREARLYKAPDRFIYPPMTWDSDTEALALFIARHTPPTAEIFIHAYSWGGGRFAPNLARAFGKLNRSIAQMTLCDPVYHDRNLLLRWVRAITPWHKIEIPANVKSVSWCRQNVDYPRAHDLVAEDPSKTRISLPEIVLSGHESIDESPQFRRMVMRCFNPF